MIYLIALINVLLTMVFARNMKQSVQPICGNAFVSLVGQDTTAINQFAKITVIITDCARSQVFFIKQFQKIIFLKFKFLIG
jgi:hypothetical protein